MKVLLSALACEPEHGSEPEVGFRTLLAAATKHEVWVMTMPQYVPAITRVLGDDPRAARIHFEAIAFDSRGAHLDDLPAWRFHRGYDRWQRDAAIRALELDRKIDFDVVHHATLASYWTRAGVAAVRKPLVWGPVGGGVDPPLRLLRVLGPRGLLEATGRVFGRPAIALLPPVSRTQRRASVILAQNPETGRRLHGRGVLMLLSNALCVGTTDGVPPGTRSTDLLFVGRLLPWKAPVLAIQALRHIEHPSAVLRLFGDGPERSRLERAAIRWGLRDRVRFEGWMPRPEFLPLLAHAGALLHPAVHDEAPLSVAEALSLGTPVVALDHGGPSQIVGQFRGAPSALVSPRDPGGTARGLAMAADRFLVRPPPVPTTAVRSTTSFEEEVLWAYELAAAEQEEP